MKRIELIAGLCTVLSCLGSCGDDTTGRQVCGNGLLDPGEVCDDGNAVSGDGCNATCTSEEYCGNGVTDVPAGEQCDDGNVISGDGCSATCQSEGSVDCGNGTVDSGEECDDGNTVSGDGCSSTCTVETPVACGNGTLDASEECDDGNNDAGDGCGPGCWIEECGNGYLDPGEVCEDGNTESGDGCSANCLSSEICGNSIIDVGEGCDDGNTANGDGCSATCQVETAATCGDNHLDPWEGCDDGNTTNGDGCTEDCLLESCGNAQLDAGEGCDDGNSDDTDACPRTCRPAICGDTFVQAGVEQCDDGNTVAGDGCSPTCQVEECGNGVLDVGEGCDDNNTDNTDSCANCQPATCGDGFVHNGVEQCDDGNTVGGDGCSANSLSNETCGNNIIDAGEVCDDGNQIDTDGCPTTCVPAICGDGFVWSGHETCDDGNTVDGDGCSSTCVLDGCGNGTVDSGEECDQGGANGTQGSSCFVNCIATTINFGTPIVIDLDTGGNANGPRAIETGDLNGDGRPDLATANQTSNTATLLYGLGDGRFWAPHVRGTGSNPWAVALADVDGDTYPDAVTANSANSTVTVLLGNGNGFDAGTSYTIVVGAGGSAPRGVALAELTGDAHLDIVTANHDSDNLTLLPGNGNGTFVTDHALVAAMCDGPVGVAVGEVTGDTHVDIVAACENSDEVTVLAGDGAGTFGPADVYTTRAGANGDQPTAIALVDVTGDGQKDVITANLASDDIVVLVANGVGGLGGPIPFSTLDGAGGGNGPRGLAVADVTGDGEPDVVTANLYSDDITLLPGVAGGATFGTAVVLTTRDGAAGQGPWGIQVADLNGDSVPDILTSNVDTDDISVFVGQGGGAFATVKVYETRPGYSGDYPSALAVGDMNDDGTIDAVVANEDHANITALAGLGDGRLAPAQTVPTTYSGPRGIVLGDLNGDNRTDWAVACTDNRMSRGLQNPSGDFITANYYINTSYGDDPFGIAVGNVDGGTDLELVVVSSYDGYANVFANDGSGNFSYSAWSVSSGAHHVALADVTGDNDLDIIVVRPTTDYLTLLPGDGTGSFGSSTSLETDISTSGQYPVWVTVVDVNDDQIPDLVTANADSNDVTLFLGLGSGSFNSAHIIPATLGPAAAEVSCVRAGDFNGDGIVDLATANQARDTVSVMLGFGDGAFSAPQSYAVGTSPYAIAVADFDGDLIDDIASADYNDGAVTVLLGLGHP